MQSIAIIGGGPAGATAAYLLARHGFKVTVVHRQSQHQYKAGETLPPVANTLLQRLGISELIQQGSHLTCPGNQSAFGSEQLVDLDFIFSPHGQGWHLDRVKFQRQLLDKAKQYGVDVIDDYKLRYSQFANNQWQLQLQSKQTERHLKADFVIDASGIARAFMRQQNIRTQTDDKLAARIAVFQTHSINQDHRTLIEAQSSGWWYSTSAPGNTRIVMFFSDMDLPAFRNCGHNKGFLKQLATTKFIADKVKQECNNNIQQYCLSFFTEPAQSTVAKEVQGQQWVAIGDSAMSFDPLSSQGIWRGLQGAEMAVQHIVAQAGKYTVDNPADEYANWTQGVYSQYLTERKSYYAMEQRWLDHIFWQRRISNHQQIAPAKIN